MHFCATEHTRAAYVARVLHKYQQSVVRTLYLHAAIQRAFAAAFTFPLKCLLC